MIVLVSCLAVHYRVPPYLTLKSNVFRRKYGNTRSNIVLIQPWSRYKFGKKLYFNHFKLMFQLEKKIEKYL